MNLRPEEATLLRWYLLGATTPDEDAQLEQRLRETEAMRDELLLAEEDLLEDYARGALPTGERELCEQNFLTTPERWQKLLIVEAAVRYAAGQTIADARAAQQHPSTPPSAQLNVTARARQQVAPAVRVPAHESPRWWRWLLTPAWKPAFAVSLLLALGWWWTRSSEQVVEKGMTALKQAYRVARPIEARISGFDYARFAQPRGNERDTREPMTVDYFALDRAERILLDAVAAHPSPRRRHALGRLYLAKGKLIEAIDQLTTALQAAPNDAALHSDLGAAWLERLRSTGTDNPQRDYPEMVNQALIHLDQGRALDEKALEPIFNRALLYQTINMYEPAREEWRRYLAQDSNSSWAEEARRNLEALEKKSENKLTPDDRYTEFERACEIRNDERAWQVYSRSYLRHGNYITGKLVDDFLDRSLHSQDEAAQTVLRRLIYLGQISERKTGDRFNAALAKSYAQTRAAEWAQLAQGRALRRQAYQAGSESRHDHAIELCIAALRLFAQGGVPEETLVTEYWIGECQLRHSEQKKSLATFTRVAEQSQAHGYKWWLALSFNRLANVQADLEDFSVALEHCQQARQSFGQMTDESGVLRTLITQANLHLVTGRYRDAIEIAQQALVMANRLQLDDSWIIVPYNVTAGSFGQLDLMPAALAFQAEAVRLSEKINHAQSISRYYVQQGLLRERLRDYPAAIKDIQRGLAAADGLQQPVTEQDMRSFARLHLGRVYRKAGQYDEALRAFAQAATFYAGKEWEALSYLIAKEKLLVRIARGEIPQARQELARVLAQFETNRRKILRESLRNSFFDGQQDIYDVAIDFAYTVLQQPAQAFEYAELSRARSLLDLTSAGYKPTDDAGTPDVIPANSTQPLSLAEIQQRLPKQTQVLQFAVFNGKLITWLVTKSALRSRTVELADGQLNTQVQIYLRQLLNPDSIVERELSMAAGELYELLIAPIEPWLDRQKQLCIVPDKAFNLIPFGALRARSMGRYLLEDYTLVYAASATLFVLSSENAARKNATKAERLLSLGNPTFSRSLFPELRALPAAAEEAEQIAPLYDENTLLLGRAATKRALLGEIEKVEVTHLAAHYVPDLRSPMLSRLALASAPEHEQRDVATSALMMHEVYHLRLKTTRLVVLSACRTGAEEVYQGEGAIGLARSFAAAGAPLVIASLWQVESTTTKELMINFHQLRRRQHAATAAALRGAQLNLLHNSDRRLRHPHYWAAFVLNGGYSQF